MKLLAELKRRNVIRMAGLYLVGAWLIVQVASTVFPAFGLPEWALRGVIVLMAIGLIPALVFSWVFELTPAGLKRDDDMGAGESIAPQTARRMDRTLIVVLLLALGYFAVDKFVLGPSRLAGGADATESTPGDSKSIAVLAFADLSQTRDQEYFSDGVAEEILNALAKVDDLKVAGRTSSFYFKGRNEALAAIGSTLGVAHVLEGSVRKQGDRLRINAKLLRVSDGVELWSETFDGTDGDIFALQESIARQVASQLKVALNAGQRDRLVDTGTTNPVAYALYLRATDVFNRRASGELLSAIALVEEAIQLDSGFARAYSRMAALYALKPEYLGSDLDDSLGTAEKLARRALELQPALSEPHAVMGYISHLQRRFLSARAEFEQALAIDPGDPLGNFWFAVTLITGGYLTTGAEQLDRTLAIDPLLPNALHHRGRLMEWMGDLEGARRLLERARSVGAQNIGLPLGQVSQRQGRMDEALAEMSAGIQFFSPGLPEDTGAVLAGGILGDATARAAALARLHGVLETPPEVVPGIVPWALITLGEPDEGLRVVATLPTSSNVWHAALWSPRGQAARTSSAFPEFARKVGFAELWDQYGPPDLCQKNDYGDYVCR
jgi:TolB-like protein